MKTVILAGGFGTRFSEETEFRPKPMIEIGGRPILWHIMKHYSHYGFNDFVICLGYRGYMIKEYFSNYFLHMADVRINLTDNSLEVLRRKAEPWKVTLVDTGLSTMTGGRLKRMREFLGNDPFLMTYGDGLADVDLESLVSFHRSSGKLATVTAVQPSGRFGALEISDRNEVFSFSEKPKGDGSWINGGFFALEPGVFDFIEGDDSIFERGPLESLANAGNLGAFRHRGFWKAMDTQRDKHELESLWASGRASWKSWND